MSRAKVIAYTIMICVVVRHLMSHEYGPLDRFLEVTVILLIAYEIWGKPFRERRKVRKLLEIAFEFVRQGQLLQASSPQGMFGPEGPAGEQIVPAWMDGVKKWNQKTLEFMEKCSPQARAAFLSNTSDGAAHEHQVGKVASDARWWYSTLLTRLDNVQRIAENPDVYF